MRSDMKRVILDTVRYKQGGDALDKYPRGRERPRDMESWPERERMRQLYWWKEKWRDVRLEPLTRFLRARVGQRWNDVYAEICAQADSRSADGRELRDYVRCEVETVPTIHRQRYSRRRLFFVDRDGILRLNPDAQRKRRVRCPAQPELDQVSAGEENAWPRTSFRMPTCGPFAAPLLTAADRSCPLARSSGFGAGCPPLSAQVRS